MLALQGPAQKPEAAVAMCVMNNGAAKGQGQVRKMQDMLYNISSYCSKRDLCNTHPAATSDLYCFTAS